MKRVMRVNRLRCLKTVGYCWQTPNGGRSPACDAGVPWWLGDRTGKYRCLAKTVRRACPCLSETGYGCVILNKTDNLKHGPQPLVGQSRTHHKRPYKT